MQSIKWRTSQNGNRYCTTPDRTVVTVKSNSRGQLQVTFTPATTFASQDDAEAYAEAMIDQLDFSDSDRMFFLDNEDSG